MDNVKYAVKNGKLHLEIDLSHSTPGVTKGGNSMCATSDNWARFPEMPGWTFNMVLVRKPGSAIPADFGETSDPIPNAMKMA